MDFGFVKLMRGEKLDELLENFPKVFLLLTYIAKNARFEDKGDGYLPGEAFVGEDKTPSQCGLTPKEFRNALNKLIEFGYIEIVYNPDWIKQVRKLQTPPPSPPSKNCQIISEKLENFKKRAIKKATKCKVVRITNSDIYDLSNENKGEKKVERRATKGRPKGDKQRMKKNEEECKEYKNLVANADVAASPPSKLEVYFSFESSTWQNIAADDIDLWQGTYPGIDIKLCLNRMADWLLSNKSRSPKSNFRAFITRWLTREQNNSANKSASKFQYGTVIDRRTRNIDGTPITSPAEGLF